ncbi:titin homolog [Diachasma alloeum]|uniref:titin homolog n=1 Tax=Diachasma alloeum TaxID=454923 RepID=UPI0007384F8A|nr:titin homolog [Diachasma alloeum]XP_015116763.1 titin homolog [Diachasma alloeum]
MEGDDGPVVINNNPSVIKAAQEEMGRLDVLVCGQCHSVFHFIEQFQEHRSKEGACSKTSHFRDNGNNEQKAQVWAFLLWKDSQIQQEGSDKDSSNSWKLYQKWCKMEANIRESWVTAGKTIQNFTRISNAKMQEAPRQMQTTDGIKSTVVVRKVIRNGQPEDNETKKTMKADPAKPEPQQQSFLEKKPLQPRPKTFVKPKTKPGKAPGEEEEENQEEFAVEKIMAKRYNTKKKCAEFLLKWEGYTTEHNSWESAEVVNTCKYLLEEFERNLAKQKELKELKAQQQLQMQQQHQQGTVTKVVARPVIQKTLIKPEISKPGPSTAAQTVRPMRSSKSKAMDQVKQWCGSMKDEESDLLGKRRIESTDSDSEDATAPKRPKVDTASDEDWTGESEEERLMGRSDVIQRAFNRANAQSNGSNKTVVTTTEVTTAQTPVLVANAKGVVKVDPKQMGDLSSGVYVLSRKEGIIKLDSTPSGKISVKGAPGGQGVLMVQNREGGTVVRKQVLSATQANSITPVKVVSKADGSQVVTQMKVISKPVTTAKPRPSVSPKIEPIKIQPKPEPTQIQPIHLVTTVQQQVGIQPRLTPTPIIRPTPQSPQPPKTPDSRPLLPRPTIRQATPTSVLGVAQVRTPVRAPAPKASPQPQPRQVLTKRIIPASAAPQIPQVRAKYTVVNSQSGPVVKTLPSVPHPPKPTPKPPAKAPQSLLSPQQKLLMAKRKAQEAAGVVGGIKAPGRTLVAQNKQVPRARGKVPVAPQASVKPKETKIVEGDGLHMEFQEVGSEDSSEEHETPAPAPQAETTQQVEPESPRPFTLCPLTGRIIGPDGEPMETGEGPEPEPVSLTTAAGLQAVVTPVTSAGGVVPGDSAVVSVAEATPTTTELILPTLESLGDAGGVMRVEMSPGGTTGTIVQGEGGISLSGVGAGSDLPCLDDTVTTAVSSNVSTVTTASGGQGIVTEGVTIPTTSVSTATPGEITSDVKEEERRVEDPSNLVTITGEDGVVYQVTGHGEDGQTLLVTRGADGEQQCVYVTTDQQGEDGSVLTLDHAVAEAVAQLIPDQVNLGSQFYVKEGEETAGENQVVMSIMEGSGTQSTEDSEGQAQVVAQVVQADDPTPGGTRRVVLLLPDGNLMMTEVDEEQYAALELDK